MDIVVKPSFREIIQRGFLSIPLFSSDILEFDLHADQIECVNGMRLKQFSGITTGNRWGKSDLISVYGSWIAAYKPVQDKFKSINIPILNTSISQDQANIVFDKFNERFCDKKHFSWFIKDIKRSPFPHILFKTGVTWWFRNAAYNGKFLEGRSYFWSNFDEADLQDDIGTFFDDILGPRLWDYGGCLSYTTTPRKGKRNCYKVHSDYLSRISSGDNSVFVFNGDSRKNPYLHPSALGKMNSLPQRLLNKNVLGLYEDTEGEITASALSFCEAIATGIQDLPTPGVRYINVWDFARSSTFNVGITVSFTSPPQLVSWERTKEDSHNKDKKYWQVIEQRVRARHAKWRGLTVVDGTGLGDVMSSYLSDINPVSLKLYGSVRESIITEGVSSIQLGDFGIPVKDINHILNGEYWSLFDELVDFDRTALDTLIWDMVCCIFIAAWYIKGKCPPEASKSSRNAPAVQPLAQGRKRI